MLNNEGKPMTVPQVLYRSVSLPEPAWPWAEEACSISSRHGKGRALTK